MSKKGPGRSAPALPPGKGRASPGRGSPGRGGRGGAASPGRGGGAPPATPLAELSPPTEKDIERKKLRDIMDRKVLVWDRMMGTEKEEDRRLGLETFKRLSEDEIALATKNMSKDKLKEFIDLKIHYFDQLANARDHDKRVEGLRRFKKVGDDEFHLAKMIGPGDSLEDMVKMRDELDKKEQAKKAEEKKKKELLDKVKKQREEMEQRIPKVSVSMTDPNMTSQMLAKQQLMHLADIEKAATENVAQVAYGMSPHDVIAQQQHLLAAAAQMPAMMAPPLSPMMPMSPLPQMMTPPVSPMPPMMPAAFYGPFPPDIPGSQTPGSAFGAVAMDLDNKMRLLSQLETTRRALQSQPVGSRSSMADEIKANLRKLNHLKMRLIDEILGEGATPAGGFGEVRTIEHVRKRDGEKSKKDRKIILEFVGPGGKISDLDVGKELGKKDGDKKQTIVLEQEFAGAIQSPSLTNTTTCPAHACPAYQQCLAYGCMASAPAGSMSQTVCPNAQYTYSHPQLNYPCAPLDIKPEVIWERTETKTYADKSTLMDPPEALKYMDAAVMSDDQTVVKEEYKHYTCEEPVYENARDVSPPPGYQLLKPNYVPVVPLAMLERGLNYLDTRVRPQHEIGISAVPMEDDPEYAPAPSAQRSCPPVISKTTIVVNRAADEAAPPPPSSPVVHVTASPVPTPAAVTPLIARLSRSSSSGRRGKRALHDSMERLARSIDDMYNTLSSPTRSRARRRSRSRSRSHSRSRSIDDDDDDSGGYVSRTTPRLHRRRRYSKRRRSRSRGFLDQWRDDDHLDEDDDEMDETTFRTRRRRSRADQDELPSLWGWLCRSLCNLTEGYDERMRAEARDMRVLQMGNRIRNLIQNVIRVSREVIEARRAIQQSGLKGEDYTKNIFAAESKLWELIDLEAQLANELALYRQSDLATDDQYFQGLANAEDKIRRLIGVETQLAREIGNWRKSSGKKLPSPSKTTIYTALSRIPSVPSMLGRSSGTSSYPLSSSPSATTSGGAGTTTTPSTSASATPTATPTSAASGAAASTSGSASSSAGSKKSKGSSKKKKKKKKQKKKSKGSSKKKKKKKRSKKSSKKKKKRKRKRKSKSRSSKSKKRKKKKRKKKKK